MKFSFENPNSFEIVVFEFTLDTFVLDVLNLKFFITSVVRPSQATFMVAAQLANFSFCFRLNVTDVILIK